MHPRLQLDVYINIGTIILRPDKYIKIARPTLKRRNYEEEESQRRSNSNPQPDYPVHQEAPDQYNKISLMLFIFTKVNFHKTQKKRAIKCSYILTFLYGWENETPFFGKDLMIEIGEFSQLLVKIVGALLVSMSKFVLEELCLCCSSVRFKILFIVISHINSIYIYKL